MQTGNHSAAISRCKLDAKKRGTPASVLGKHVSCLGHAVQACEGGGVVTSPQDGLLSPKHLKLPETITCLCIAAQGLDRSVPDLLDRPLWHPFPVRGLNEHC